MTNKKENYIKEIQAVRSVDEFIDKYFTDINSLNEEGSVKAYFNSRIAVKTMENYGVLPPEGKADLAKKLDQYLDDIDAKFGTKDRIIEMMPAFKASFKS